MTERRWLSTRPNLLLALRIGSLFGVFVVLDHVVRRVGELPVESYAEPYLFWELLHRLGLVPTIGIAVLVAALSRYGLLFDGWNELELARKLRVFIVFLASLIAWPLATYGYNFYFDQGYYVDRALLVLLVPLIWRRPVFIYPFLVLAFGMLGQLAQPALGGGAHFPHMWQVLLVLNGFAAFFLVHAFSGSRRADTFVLLTCCVVASAYWAPGIGKVELGWITQGQLYHMLPAAYAQGWLSFLGPATIVTLTKALAHFDWPMRVFVLSTELGFLFFLSRRPVSIVLVIAVTLFHVATFAIYGFLFWIWMALDIAVVLLLVGDRDATEIDLYRAPYVIASMLLIASSGYWANPSTLAWFDTRLTYTYRYQVIGATGKSYVLPPRFFAPYGDDFAMGNFSYLVEEHRMLVGPYGVTVDRERAERMMDVSTPSAIFSLESELGADPYDVRRAEIFRGFVTRYLENWNSSHDERIDVSAFGPPPLFWSLPRGETYDGQEEIRTLIVKEVTSLYDGEQLREIRELELLRLDIRTPGGVDALGALRESSQP